MVKGASKGEGLGNKFLANIREVDAIIHVVRCFDDDHVVHVNGRADPLRDIETVNLELILADMEHMERRLDKTRKMAKGGDKKIQAELNFEERLYDHLAQGRSARMFDMKKDDRPFIRNLSLLSAKPVLYVANIAEDALNGSKESEHTQAVRRIAEAEAAEVVQISARIEEEIGLDEERRPFLDEFTWLIRIG